MPYYATSSKHCHPSGDYGKLEQGRTVLPPLTVAFPTSDTYLLPTQRPEAIRARIISKYRLLTTQARLPLTRQTLGRLWAPDGSLAAILLIHSNQVGLSCPHSPVLSSYVTSTYVQLNSRHSLRRKGFEPTPSTAPHKCATTTIPLF